MQVIDSLVHSKLWRCYIIASFWMWSTLTCAQTIWQPLAEGLDYTTLPTNQLGGKLHAFRVSPQKYRFRVDLARNHAQQNLSIKSFVQKNNALIGINGGFFSPEWQPLGLRMHAKKTQSPFKNISWWGVATFSDEEGLQILSPTQYRTQTKKQEALQCGPRLVINGNIPRLKPAIAERSALCLDKKKNMLVIIANNHPVSIQHFAKILVKSEKENGLDCIDALNLDGGSSSQLYSQHPNKPLFLAGLSLITDAVLILPKKANSG